MAATSVTLLEVAVQGLPGLPPSLRIPLRPGLNAVQGSTPSREAFTRLLWAVLFADPSWLGNANSKAALSFLAGDNQTYRLLVPGAGAVQLSRLDAQAGKFELVPTPAGIATALAELGFPARELFEGLFVFSRPPAKPAAEVARSSPSGSGGAKIENKFADLADEMSKPNLPTTPEGIRARLAEVEKEEREAAEIEQTQFQLDGLQQQLFQAEDVLKTLDGLVADLDRAEAELRALPTVTPEIMAKVKRLPALVQKRDDALKRIVAERAELEQHGEGALQFASLANEPPFWGSVLAGAICIAVSVLASQGSWLRWLALGDVAAFGIAAVLAAQRLSQMRDSVGAARKLALLTEREARVMSSWEVESRDVQALMKSLGVEGGGELEDRLAAREALVRRRDEMAERVRSADEEEGGQERRVARDDLRSRVATLEQQLAAFGGYRRERSELQKERTDLTVALGRLEGGAPAAGGPDASGELLDRAAGLFGATPAGVVQGLKDQLSQALGALTNRQMTGLTLTAQGLAVVYSGGVATAPFARLSESDQRTVMTALRLCVLERYFTDHRLFLLLDEASDGLDGPRRALCIRYLKRVTQRGQGLWLGDAAVELADHRVALG